jgi:hypothetical protein
MIDVVMARSRVRARCRAQITCSLTEAIALTLAEFQLLVASHPDKFAGVHPHPAADFDEFERALGHPLPESLRWLLSTHGYSECCGVDNLTEAVEQTIACRNSIGLPCDWLLLNDWGDGGIVLLDLSTGRICWCGAHNAANLADGKIDSDADWFSGYPEWTACCVEDAD